MPDRHPFVLALRDQFPEMKEAVDSYEIAGLLHCEVGEFEGADAGLKNALHVSYVEAFAWGTPHEQTARALMPERLALAFDGMLAWPHPHPTDGAV